MNIKILQPNGSWFHNVLAFPFHDPTNGNIFAPGFLTRADETDWTADQVAAGVLKLGEDPFAAVEEQERVEAAARAEAEAAAAAQAAAEAAAQAAAEAAAKAAADQLAAEQAAAAKAAAEVQAKAAAPAPAPAQDKAAAPAQGTK